MNYQTLFLIIIVFSLGILVGYLIWLTISKKAEQKHLIEQTEERERAAKALEEAQKEQNTLLLQNRLLQQQKEQAEKSLETTEKQYEARIKEQKDNFEQQLKAMTMQFQSLSEDITKRRADELSKSNITQMDALLKPLKLQIEMMEKSFKEGRESGVEQTSRLEKHINMLVEQSLLVGSQAENLAEALRMKSKVQGNWGETILEQMLQSEGLQEGIHYSAQATLEGETRNYLRPDIIIHYPDERDLVVDAKVSLTAYSNYFQSETEEERDLCATAHLKSMQEHVKELARKEYQSFIKPPKKSLDYVVMFVPISGALQLANEKDGNFWKDALQKGVFVVDDRNLFVLLRMVSLVWRQYDQDRNIDEIIKHAHNLVQRTANFFDDLETLKRHYNSLGNALDQAELRFKGRQSLLGSAEKIVQLGVKSKKELPESIDDTPDTE